MNLRLKRYLSILCIIALMLSSLSACGKKLSKEVEETTGLEQQDTKSDSDQKVAVHEETTSKEGTGEEANQEAKQEAKQEATQEEKKEENTPIAVVEETPPKETVEDYQWPEDFSLYKAYEDYFLIGTIYSNTSKRPKDKELIIKHFNVITPENLMKPEYMQPQEGNFSYSETKVMQSYANNNNMKLVGHTLVWHAQSGNWLGQKVSREVAIEQLRSHITNIVTTFKGEFLAWDVVNEAINDGATVGANGDWRVALRQTQWLKSIGSDYIEMAFQFAREADPDLKLYYNDYNLNNKAKADVVYAMVKDFKERGIPIDGIGMQGHYSAGMSMSGVEYSLNKFSELGVEVSITELDVGVSGAASTGLTEKEEVQQAITYAKLFKLFKSYKDTIARVTFWGNVDNLSWRKENHPCLFNQDYTLKEAAYAVLNPELYLELHGVDTGAKKATVLEAKYGTPVIDGDVDEIWNTTAVGDIKKQLYAWEGATGKVRTLWDEKYVYVLVDITDSVLNKASSNTYEQDSVELYLDQNHGGTGYYDSDDGQYRINYMGSISYGTVPTTSGFLAKAKLVDGGYRIEARIPLVVESKAGMIMGFEAQINDADAGGTRRSLVKFNDDTDDSYNSTEYWGDLKLVK